MTAMECMDECWFHLVGGLTRALSAAAFDITTKPAPAPEEPKEEPRGKPEANNQPKEEAMDSNLDAEEDEAAALDGMPPKDLPARALGLCRPHCIIFSSVLLDAMPALA
jgi:hypothetical protein